MSDPIIRYRPGEPIDTRQILEVVGLATAQWGPIEQAYPEIATAGARASFRAARNVTIFPPSYVSAKLLRMLLGAGDAGHRVYPHPDRQQPTSVLVHVYGGYASLHIYRLRPARRG